MSYEMTTPEHLLNSPICIQLKLYCTNINKTHINILCLSQSVSVWTQIQMSGKTEVNTQK